MASVCKDFLSSLSDKARKAFTTKSEFCMSVYTFWQEKGYITESQMANIEKGFNGVAKNRSYFGIHQRVKTIYGD